MKNNTPLEIDLTRWIMQDSFKSQRSLLFPVAVYTDDNSRENLFKHSGTLTFGSPDGIRVKLIEEAEEFDKLSKQ
ncbi:MAG TPA: hypothetical protein VJ438_02985 [Candidatus Nanoarchaeia archaeon]|nr:hypothetical protein [Candidatus Nanoarchaeia archaeon]